MVEAVDVHLRDFIRYTGDGLPNAPIGAPLPVGDPASGIYNPKKSDLRAAMNGAAAAADAAAALADARADAAELYAPAYFNDVTAMIAAPSLPVGTTRVNTRDGFAYDVVGADPDLSAPALLRGVSPHAVFHPEAFESGSAITDLGLGRAMYAAMRAFDTGRPATVLLPSREIVIDGDLEIITRPIAIIGQGWKQSLIRRTNAGRILTVRDCGFGPQDANDYPFGGDSAYTSPATMRSGFRLHGVQMTGNRTVAQQGVVFEGNCDNVAMSDVALTYLRGEGLYLGAPRGTVRGNVRESDFNNIALRDCGDTGAASLYIYRAPTSVGNPSQDSSNINTLRAIQMIYPHGHGVHFYAPESADGISPLYGFDIDIHAHSYSGGSGDLVRIEGDVASISGRVYSPVQHQDAQAVVRQLVNGASQPRGIDLDVDASNARNVVIIEGGYGYRYKLHRPVAQVSTVNIGASAGVGEVYIHNDPGYVELEGPLALAGAGGVVLAMSAGTTNAASFFGARTSLAVSIDGIVGTVTVAAGVYTFTPSSAITETIPQHRAVLSKVIASRAKLASITGRWRSYHSDVASRVEAVNLSGSVLKRLDQFGFYTADNLTRYGYMHTKQADQVVIGVTNSGGAETDLLALKTNDATPRIDAVRSIRFTPQWNSAGMLQIGTAYLWRDLTMQNILRFKVASVPGSETDGTPISMKVGVPASAGAVGAPGWWAADASYAYFYTGDGTTHAWRRVAVASW